MNIKTASSGEGGFRGVAYQAPRTGGVLQPYALAALAVALLVPMASWTMSLSNRVAVLESQSSQLQNAAVQIAQLKQEVTDFRYAFDQWKIEMRTRPENLTPLK